MSLPMPVTRVSTLGPSPIRVVTLKIGSRRPLGLGAGGLAILAGLPSSEGASVLRTVLPQIERDWPQAEVALRTSIDEARRQGYAFIRNRISSGISAIGMPFGDAGGRTVGALSIASVNSRMTASRLGTLATLLRRAVQDVERTRRAEDVA